MRISVDFSDCEGFEVIRADEDGEYELVNSHYTVSRHDGKIYKIVQLTLVGDTYEDEEIDSYSIGFADGIREGQLHGTDQQEVNDYSRPKSPNGTGQSTGCAREPGAQYSIFNR